MENEKFNNNLEVFNNNLKEDEDGANSFVVFVFGVFEICVQALVVVVIVFSLFFKTVGVIGGSMNNTLEDKDRLLVINRLFHKPQQKDIVILNTVDILDDLIVKRIIATQGQEVNLKKEGKNYFVYVDGVKLEEDYIKEPILEQHVGNLTYPFVVPKGCVFAMGDNRNNSKDSREFGPVNVDKIMGSCAVRMLPIRKFGIL